MDIRLQLHPLVSRTILTLILSLPHPALADNGSSNSAPATLSPRELDNLVAFTKLYGYVRFFHPSDEAAALDWERFAVFGSDKILQCASQGELVSKLHQLFTPVAPSLLIYGTQNHPVGDVSRYIPVDTLGLKPVSWQHLGVGLSPQSVYRSIRLNRKSIDAGVAAFGFGSISGSLDPAPLAGKRLTFRAAVRTDEGSKAQLWLRVDRHSGAAGFFDNMDDRPIRSTAWKTYEISGTVDSDAVRIAFGCMLVGSGKIWVDDVHLFTGDGRDEIRIPNSDFEKDTVGAVPHGWFARPPGYSAEVTGGNAASGTKSVVVRSVAELRSPELFPERPSSGDAAVCELSATLRARVPLVLFSDSSGTLPHADVFELEGLKRQMEESLPKTLAGNDRTVRLGDIVIAWNVFQHFYPYFDITGVNWENELRPALAGASADTSQTAFLLTLRKLVAKLRDGHGNVQPGQELVPAFFSPIQWMWTEDKLVVTAVYDSSKVLPSVGDVVLEINGKKARQAVEEEEAYASGATPQWKRIRALNGLLNGPESSLLTLALENTGGKKTSAIARTFSAKRYYDSERERQPRTGRLTDSVYYVNLSRSSMAEIDSLMPALATARGIVFDLRGYPNANHELISHLLTAPDTSAHWMGVPKTIYPDRKKPAGFVYSGWQLRPKLPHIAGKVVFLTDGRAVSYAESFMSFIENYKLADIVGEPTAGTNGNINPFPLPGGFRIVWTGMRVTKHNGSQHHGVGIQPTVTVHPTVKGIREGRDEQLEVALEIINKASK